MIIKTVVLSKTDDKRLLRWCDRVLLPRQVIVLDDLYPACLRQPSAKSELELELKAGLYTLAYFSDTPILPLEALPTLLAANKNVVPPTVPVVARTAEQPQPGVPVMGDMVNGQLTNLRPIPGLVEDPAVKHLERQPVAPVQAPDNKTVLKTAVGPAPTRFLTPSFDPPGSEQVRDITAPVPMSEQARQVLSGEPPAAAPVSAMERTAGAVAAVNGNHGFKIGAPATPAVAVAPAVSAVPAAPVIGDKPTSAGTGRRSGRKNR